MFLNLPNTFLYYRLRALAVMQFLVLGLLAPTHGVMAMSPEQVAQTLTQRDQILVMRHADAPGYSDPLGFRLGDCSTQRNLGDVGRTQARAIGAWLAQGLQASSVQKQIYSSPWCRCEETARLLQLGPVRSEAVWGSFFERPQEEGRFRQGAKQFLKERFAERLPHSPNPAMIVVTHQINLTSLIGSWVNVGEMIVLKFNANGEVIAHQRLAPVPY